MPEAGLNKQHHMLGSEQTELCNKMVGLRISACPQPSFLPLAAFLGLAAPFPALCPREHKRWGLCSLTQGMPWPREQGEGRLGCLRRWPACDAVRTMAPSLRGVFGALGLPQEGLQK